MVAAFSSNRNLLSNEFSMLVETDFLSSSNNIILFRDFCSVCGNREIQFLKNNLIPASGN